jgi:ABC-type Fe3+ transport system substrate-binding protein
MQEGKGWGDRAHAHPPSPDAAVFDAHLVEAGGTWWSEAIFQKQIGNPIAHVDIPTAVNTLANYSAAMVAGAPHPQAARAWLDFVGSDDAFKILQRCGFKRFVAKAAIVTPLRISPTREEKR